MKIKHFSGYGSVNAKKTKHVKTGENTKRVIIKVFGNHEQGLYRPDTYDIYNWLLKRFAKDCKSYKDVVFIGYVFNYELINDTDTETCTYVIDYIFTEE